MIKILCPFLIYNFWCSRSDISVFWIQGFCLFVAMQCNKVENVHANMNCFDVCLVNKSDFWVLFFNTFNTNALHTTDYRLHTLHAHTHTSRAESTELRAESRNRPNKTQPNIRFLVHWVQIFVYRAKRNSLGRALAGNSNKWNLIVFHHSRKKMMYYYWIRIYSRHSLFFLFFLFRVEILIVVPYSNRITVQCANECLNYHWISWFSHFFFGWFLNFSNWIVNSVKNSLISIFDKRNCFLLIWSF